MRISDWSSDVCSSDLMAAYVDGQGECQGIAVSEHHASDDGFLPSPIVMASAIAAVTKRTPIAIAAALLPLYDPVRLAEEMIVLDHISRGRDRKSTRLNSSH